MNHKTWHKASKVQEEPFKMKSHVSGGNNFIEVGLQDGLAGKAPQYPEFLHYYMAWASGYREYLLGDSTTPVA